MDRSYVLIGAALGALWFGACQVYTPEDLTGGGQGGGDSETGGATSGGSAGSSGDGTGGSSGDTMGGGGTSGSTATGGSAGDDPAGGKGGGGTTGGSNNGGSMTGGSSGSGSGGKGGSAGAAAGMAGMASGGTAGAGGAGAGAGAGGAGSSGAGAGGAGSGGKAGGGAGGSASGAGGSGGGTVVLLTGTASADSSESGHPPGDANDGVTTTRWCAANSAAGHYWTLDLGAVHTLSRFEVTWEYPSQAAGLAYGYFVSTSTDGTTFTQVIDRSTNTDTMQTQSSDFPVSTSARHVRITVSTLPPSSLPSWASFYEVRVYGQ